MREYDYEKELLYWRTDKVRYRLGSTGSFIMVCPTCGEEHFCDEISPHEQCFQGHGPMEPLTEENEDRYRSIWGANGYRITTVEERRAQRLAEEKERKAQ